MKPNLMIATLFALAASTQEATASERVEPCLPPRPLPPPPPYVEPGPREWSVVCPRCGAAVGKKCMPESSLVGRRIAHGARVAAARVKP